MKRLYKYIPIILLCSISLVLFLANYIPHTFLIGWDNLMPEFDLILNIKRNIFAVWQDYRGLGLLDGQAHSANIIHTLFVSLVRLFLPTNMTRYFVILFLHLIGGIGMYYMSLLLTKKKIPSIIAAIFYMFNIGIIQQFYAPLETFAFHFAFLPFLVYWSYRYIYNPSKQTLIWFTLTNILMTPQAFVPTIFVINLCGYIFVAMLDIIKNHSIRRFATLLSILFVINSFWLLPYIYDVPNKSHTIQSARINEFSSEETFLKNKARGNFLDVVTMRGFMLDIKEYDDDKGVEVQLMKGWTDFMKNPLYMLSSGTFFTIALIGFIYSWNSLIFLPLYGILLLSFFFLGTDIPLLSSIIGFIRNHVPLFGEAVRFPFTKFITMFAFGYSIFFAKGLVLLSEKALSYSKKSEYFLFGIISCVLIFITIPAFSGNFFSKSVKNAVPEDYRTIFTYLNTYNPTTRIALLPTNTFWSWQSRNWGYLGSGFEWFGIQQPILSRAFDPWSTANEQFYTELSYAFTTEDRSLLKNVLQKYDVGLLLLDKTINNELSTKSINYEKINEFLLSSNFISPLQNLENLTLYRVDSVQSKVFLTNKPLYFGSTQMHSKIDESYRYGETGIFQPIHPDITYLFPSLITDNLQKDREFDTVSTVDSLTIATTQKVDLPQNTEYNLIVPSILDSEELIPTKIVIDNNNISINVLYPTLYIDEQKISVPGEIYIQPIKKGLNQRLIINSDTEITSGQKAHLLNHFLNVIKIIDSKSEQTILLDTNTQTIHKPFVLPISFASIHSVKANLELINDHYSYVDILHNLQYARSIQPEIVTSKCVKHNSSQSVFEFGQLILGSVCQNNEIAYSLDNLPHNASYMLKIQNKHTDGLPLTVYINNENEKRTEFQSRLSRDHSQNIFFMYPSQKAFNGYGLHLLSQSFNQDRSQDTIEAISLFPLPLRTLGQIFIKKADLPISGEQNRPISNKKFGNFLYVASVGTSGTVTLTEAYHRGWIAVLMHGSRPIKLLNHFLVNNWANGWEIPKDIPSDQLVIIIFWPQLLQFIGFFLAAIGIVWVVVINKQPDRP